MIHFDYTEFYITNVCNLNCENCNRFNNYNFSGHTRWHEVQEYNAKWASLLDISRIGILGGEPMLNPDFLLWVQGIAELWPSSKIVIMTNGTQLGRWPQLYDCLLKYRDRMLLEINCHNQDAKKTLIQSVHEFLGDCTVSSMHQKDVGMIWNQYYKRIKDPEWPDCAKLDDFDNLPDHVQKQCHEVHHISPEIWYQEICRGLRFVNQDGIRCELRMMDQFRQSAVKYDGASHVLSLHDNDPDRAMSVCSFKKCHHIIRGKLYKCGPVGILPEFVKQFNIKLSTKQQDLIDAYTPAEVDWDIERLQSFANDLRAAVPIPQCSFCTDKMPGSKIFSTTKKITFLKKNRLHY